MDLPVPILTNPKRSFRPREAGVPAAARRRDRGHHTAGDWIDLLDPILGELKQVVAVERRSRMRGDIDRTHSFTARGIKGLQCVAGSKPDTLAVIRDAVHVIDTRKRPIFPDNFGC